LPVINARQKKMARDLPLKQENRLCGLSRNEDLSPRLFYRLFAGGAGQEEQGGAWIPHRPGLLFTRYSYCLSYSPVDENT
jgi:hypothetical protein